MTAASTYYKFFAVLTLIVTGILVGASIYVAEYFKPGFAGLPWTLVGVSILAVVTTVYGVVGAARNDLRKLYVAFIVLIATALMTILLGVLCLVYKEYVYESVSLYAQANTDFATKSGYTVKEYSELVVLGLKVLAGLAFVSAFFQILLIYFAGRTISIKASAKKTIQAFCVMVFLLGAALFGVGAYAYKGGYSDTIAPGVAGLGVALVLVAVLGYIAAAKESSGLLNAFLALVVIAAIVLLAIGIAALVKAKDKAAAPVSADKWPDQYLARGAGAIAFISAILLAVTAYFVLSLKPYIGHVAESAVPVTTV
eukprot:tig00000605_g2474.t1